MNSPKRKAAYGTLAQWREAHSLTLKEAGAALGYSEAGYFKLERGQRYPRREDLRRIQKLTGVALEVLAGVA